MDTTHSITALGKDQKALPKTHTGLREGEKKKTHFKNEFSRFVMVSISSSSNAFSRFVFLKNHFHVEMLQRRLLSASV